jgi:hypothetical protein
VAHYIVSGNVKDTPYWQLFAVFDGNEAQAAIVAEAYGRAFPEHTWHVEATTSTAPNTGVPVLDMQPLDAVKAAAATRTLSTLLAAALMGDVVFSGMIGDEIALKKIGVSTFAATVTDAIFERWKSNERARLQELTK